MRGCGMRGCAVRVGAIRVAGVEIGGVGVSTVTVPCIAAVPGVPVSIVSDVSEAADCHRGEASTAQREAKPIDVHMTNTTCRATAW